MRLHGLTVAVVLVAGPALAAGDRAKVPDADAQAKAEKVIKDLFKADYARRRPTDIDELAGKLFEQAGETADDPASRYVLLRESMNLAGQVGDVVLILKGVDATAANFDVSKAEVMAPVFEKALPSIRSPARNQMLAEAILPEVAEATKNDDYATADRLLKVADIATRKAQSAPLYATVVARSRELARLRKDYDKAKAAINTLDRNPTDPDANLTAGEYYCFLKGDWDKGLPMLVQGKDDKLKALAEKELRYPQTPADQLELGDAWYDAAADQDAATRPQLQLRAYHWYEQALPGLTGLNKTKVEKRTADLEKTLESHRDRSEIFTTIRDAVREKKTKDSQSVGGAFAKVIFREVPPEGAVLVGFEVGVGKFVNNDVIDYLRPIYLTSAGQKLGHSYGARTPRTVVYKARKGYAVGAVTVKGGGGLDGLSITFMPIGSKSLKTEGAYTTPWIGGEGGGAATTVGGDGSLVVGIQGRRFEETRREAGKIGGLGVVLVEAAESENPK